MKPKEARGKPEHPRAFRPDFARLGDRANVEVYIASPGSKLKLSHYAVGGALPSFRTC